MKNELEVLRIQVEEVQRQLQMILEQIYRLENKDTQNQNEENNREFSSGISLSRELRTIPDFPNMRSIMIAIKKALYRRKIFNEFEDDWKCPTVDDLLKLSEVELLASDSMGKGRLKKVTDWMKKYGFEFYYMKKR